MKFLTSLYNSLTERTWFSSEIRIIDPSITSVWLSYQSFNRASTKYPTPNTHSRITKPSFPYTYLSVESLLILLPLLGIGSRENLHCAWSSVSNSISPHVMSLQRDTP
ncbi:hypothetical protein Pst134EA_019664 [Puccinia striiformis f. sp. tritici]|uniref:hypothetical protein n=1 Tax=Puccinia striiformis f. sp. tritici TaxID=168172 RepID=UPI0020075505|nr:hypothetical protein Pst134EA_019664 [Puccinia striiformis f. sp. tritici]KAH9449763.1 hypothetical protein Pst134EB_020579 [Puccinia striiformis f. sp. tritici]KAH9459515.1 hypothetical protein Pst134EA_019664 [Puccinia striiformis f. sp. tritici]